MIEGSMVLVTEKNEAIITCPNCKKFKRISVDKYKNEKHYLNIHCKCGHLFQVKLDFRKGTRKKCNIEGTYRYLSSRKSSAKMCRVVNLSYRGICIKTFNEHNFYVGDQFLINFQLDDKSMTFVERKVEVVSLSHEDHIGGIFIDHESDGLNKAIAFYLMH